MIVDDWNTKIAAGGGTWVIYEKQWPNDNHKRILTEAVKSAFAAYRALGQVWALR